MVYGRGPLHMDFARPPGPAEERDEGDDDERGEEQPAGQHQLGIDAFATRGLAAPPEIPAPRAVDARGMRRDAAVERKYWAHGRKVSCPPASRIAFTDGGAFAGRFAR